MRGCEGPDMDRFGIRPSSASELDAAYLTAIVVELLERLGVRGFLDDSFLPLCVCIHCDQPKTPDKKSRSPNAPPVVVNRVQAVIPIAGIGRIGRTEAGPTDNADGQAVQSVLGQSPIATGEDLVAYLLVGLEVASTVAGIEDHTPIILSILIAAGQDHRIGAFPPTAGNAGNAGPVHPGPGERLARGEVGANRIAWNMAKPAFGHGLDIYESGDNGLAVRHTGPYYLRLYQQNNTSVGSASV